MSGVDLYFDALKYLLSAEPTPARNLPPISRGPATSSMASLWLLAKCEVLELETSHVTLQGPPDVIQKLCDDRLDFGEWVQRAFATVTGHEGIEIRTVEASD